jgi:hypothetical protein
MAKTYIVVSFTKNGNRLVADPLKAAKTADSAIALATRLAEAKAGAVAFEQSHDPDTESYDEPVILFKAGEVPPELEG